MTEQEYASKKRGLQVRIGRWRAATRKAETIGEKQRAMKTVQQLENQLSRMTTDHCSPDGA